MELSRIQLREGFDISMRLRLLENDADEMEASVARELKGFREELDGMKKIMVGILISLATACVLMVVNLIAVGVR